MQTIDEVKAQSKDVGNGTESEVAKSGQGQMSETQEGQRTGMKEALQEKARVGIQTAKSYYEQHVLPGWRRLCARAKPVLTQVWQKVTAYYRVCCDWIRTTWQSGRNGRIKIVAGGCALLLVGGVVFAMMGSKDSGGESVSNLETSGSAKEGRSEASRSEPFAMQQDIEEDRGWLCSYKECCAVFYSPSKPYGSMGGPCGHGGSHFWTEKGRAGSTIYRCQNCGLVMHMSETPWSGAQCPRGASHFWVRQY